MNQAERNEKIAEYGRGFDLLKAALAGMPREAWEFKPAPQVWSVHEIILHMADSEMMGVTRLHKLIAEPGSTLMGYDDAKWAEALSYQKQSIEDALELFRLMRQTSHQVLKNLPDRIFAHTVVHPEMAHPEYGEGYTLEKWLNIYTGHVGEHIEQLQNNYLAWKEQNK